MIDFVVFCLLIGSCSTKFVQYHNAGFLCLCHWFVVTAMDDTVQGDIQVMKSESLQ